jgi:hypothetical protein
MEQRWIERSNKPAQIVWTISKSDRSNAWALVETIGSNRDQPIIQIWVPAHKAEEVVAIINDAHAALTRKLVTCAKDDPDWGEYSQRMGFPVTDILRRRGRPPLDPQERRPAEVTAYLHAGHSVEETAAHFDNMDPATVLTYEKRWKLAISRAGK